MTAPLVPAEVDLRGFSGFMLDVDRLLASELVALGTPEECWAATMLWCRAWKQQPPGSLPDDDRILAAFSGTGKRWPKVKAMALRGFVKCDDGRLYHRVLCEEVNKAWERRSEFRETTNNKTERQRRWRERQKELSARLRDLGVTPPVGASLETLQRLVDDAEASTPSTQASTQASTAASTRDGRETPLTGTGTGTKKEQKPSRPPAGEGLPESAHDPGRELWANAIAMLRDQGVSEGSARSFIGLQCRTWDDDTVAEAFSAAAGQANVKGYVLAVLKGKPKRSEQPQGVEFRHGQATIGGFVP
ncbi:MAG: YdaU family protein [Burkholderiaceae bacterium]|jgi:uncharacterized protein YdaU (DUF1376 family)|nr:YdaU family protein [Burkholderiaceae bacterium]